MQQFYSFVSTLQLDPIDYLILLVNIALIIFARPLLRRLTSTHISDKAFTLRVNILRALNLIILIVFGYENFYVGIDGDHEAPVMILTILAILYLTYIVNYIVQFLINKQYGKARTVGDQKLYVETYQSRLFSLLAIVVLTLISLIAIIRELGFESLLETGGVLGVCGVFLALTQASWAPDIISGLIILNSDMFEEGDIIEIEGTVCRIYRTKLFHTEAVNLSNNHRIMLRNANIRDQVIHNLSKYASGKGLRECLNFNIGYEVESQAIKAMFLSAFEKAVAAEVPVEANSDPEIKVLDTGDHAVKWGFIVHIRQVDEIITIRRALKEFILEESKLCHISLATPLTHVATVQNKNPGA